MKKIKIILTTFSLLFVLKNIMAMEKNPKENLTEKQEIKNTQEKSEDEPKFETETKKECKKTEQIQKTADLEKKDLKDEIKTTPPLNLNQNKTNFKNESISLDEFFETRSLKENFKNNLESFTKTINQKIDELEQIKKKCEFSKNDTPLEKQNKKELKEKAENQINFLEKKLNFSFSVLNTAQNYFKQPFLGEMLKQKLEKKEDQEILEDKLKEKTDFFGEMRDFVKQAANVQNKKNNYLLEQQLDCESNQKIKKLITNLKYIFNSLDADYEKLKTENVKAVDEIADKFYKIYANHLSEILKIIKNSIPKISEDDIFNDKLFFEDIKFDNKIDDLKNIIDFVKNNRKFNNINEKISQNLKQDCKNLYLTKEMTPSIKVFEDSFEFVKERNKDEIINLKENFKNFGEIFKEFIKYYDSLSDVLQNLTTNAAYIKIDPEKLKRFMDFYKNIFENKDIFSENLYEDYENYFKLFCNFFEKCNIHEKKQFFEDPIENRAKSKALKYIIKKLENRDYDYIDDLLNNNSFNDKEDKDFIIALLKYDKKKYQEEIARYKYMLDSFDSDFTEIENSSQEKTKSIKEKMKEIEKLKSLFLEMLMEWEGDENFSNKKDDYNEYLNQLIFLMTPKNDDDPNFNKITITNEIDPKKNETIFTPKCANITDFQEHLLDVLYLLEKKHIFSNTFFKKFQNYKIYKKNYFLNFQREVLDLYSKKIGVEHKKCIKLIFWLMKNIDCVYSQKQKKGNYDDIKKMYIVRFKDYIGLNKLAKNDLNYNDLNYKEIKKIKNVKNLTEYFFKNYLDNYYKDLANYYKTENEEEKEFLKEKLKVKINSIDLVKSIIKIENFQQSIMQDVLSKKLEKKLSEQFIKQVYGSNLKYAEYLVLLTNFKNEFKKFCEEKDTHLK